MTVNDQIGKLEALLFIYGEPMPYKKIAELLKIKTSEAATLAEQLTNQLTERGSGLVLISDKEKAQLVTHPNFGKLLEEVVKDEFTETLSPASLETLSIITYAAPISRAEIEYIRGVNSSFTLRSLLLRGLVERASDPKRANAFVYSPTFDFLKHIGITDRTGLPEFNNFQKLLTTMRQPVENEQPLQPKSE